MSLMDTFNGALTLNQRMLAELRDSPDVVRRGLLIVLLVGLLVGVAQSISGMITSANPDQVATLVREQYREVMRQQGLQADSAEQREAVRLLEESEEAVVGLVRDLASMPAALPRPLALLLQALGQAVSTPLGYLNGMLLAVALAHVAARQLGGQGSIRQMVGLGALSVAPHALDALSFVPVLSGPLSLIAWGWGLAVLIIATSVAHRLDSGRATLAVLLYPSLLILLGLLLSCILFVLLLTVAASA